MYYHSGVLVINDILGHGAIGRSSMALFTIRNVIATRVNVISRISWCVHFGVCINALAWRALKINLMQLINNIRLAHLKQRKERFLDYQWIFSELQSLKNKKIKKNCTYCECVCKVIEACLFPFLHILCTLEWNPALYVLFLLSTYNIKDLQSWIILQSYEETNRVSKIVSSVFNMEQWSI